MAAACNWCQQGECWTHGQVAAGFKGGNGQWGGKGGGKGGKAEGGKAGKMKQMWQMMMQWYGPGTGGGGGGGGGGGESGQTNYKGHLSTVYLRSCKSSGTEKGEVSYETAEVEPRKGYQSVVTIGEATYTGEISPGKKAAEHAAAKAALNDMFPDDCEPPAAGGGADWNMQAMMSTMSGKGSGGGGGKKRSREESSGPQPIVSKSRLVHVLSLILGRPGTKADTEWQVEEAEGKYIGSVTLTEMSKTFTGEPAASKKEAENAAADAALEALADQIATLEEEHKEKKAKKRAESSAALNLKREEKAEERKAAKAAAKEAKEA